MKPTLKPAGYQLVPLTKLLLNGGNGILIADGVGVGKTISAGYVIDRFIRGESGPCLVLCPPSLVDKWRFELKLKFNLNARLARSGEEIDTTRSELRVEKKGQVCISTYTLLTEIGTLPSFPLVVVDEIHNFRNSKTHRWGALFKIMSKASWRVGLSATPINNVESDLGSEFSLLLTQYSPPVISAYIEDIWREGHYDKLSPFVTRFTKEELGIHFAKREIHSIRVAYPKDYTERVRNVVSQRRGRLPKRGSYPVDSITLFREAASSPIAFEISTRSKLHSRGDPKLEALRTLLERETSRVLVFCQFVQTVNYLSKAVGDRDVFILTGDVPVSDREALIDAFRMSRTGVLFMTSVGSEGLDLQFCNVVVNYDIHWNPMVLEQRIGRCDRLGQKKSEIRVYNLHVANSIDDRVLLTLGRKLGMMSGSLFDPKAIVNSSEPLFDNQSVEDERKLATSVLRALEYAVLLKTQDPAIVPFINVRYCRPGATVGVNPMAWLAPGSETRRWINLIHRNADDFTQGAGRLQSYVD